MKLENTKPNSNLITAAQVNYIELLTLDLGFNIQRRNVHIKSILDWFDLEPHLDLYTLNKQQASKIIGKFKEWKEKPDLTNQENFNF